MEGGIGTPLVDKILVADLYGVAYDSGKILYSCRKYTFNVIIFIS